MTAIFILPARLMYPFFKSSTLCNLNPNVRKMCGVVLTARAEDVTLLTYATPLLRLLEASMTLRRLSLHPSALSDAEYALFTTSLADLADIDAADPAIDYEQITVSVREARAWLCGRYASLGSGVIDEVHLVSFLLPCFLKKPRFFVFSPHQHLAVVQSLRC